MIKIKGTAMVMFLFILFSCVQVKKEPVENSHRFFKKLSKNGGTWVHFPTDTTIGFHSFIMKFELHESDTLKGSILGSTKTGDTIPFWNVQEYMVAGKDSAIFMQIGEHGRANGKSFFPDSLTRESSFKMVYSNGAFQKHKDTHTFANDSTLLTKSQIFQSQTQEWVPQPDAIWTFKPKTEEKEPL